MANNNVWKRAAGKEERVHFNSQTCKSECPQRSWPWSLWAVRSLRNHTAWSHSGNSLGCLRAWHLKEGHAVFRSTWWTSVQQGTVRTNCRRGMSCCLSDTCLHRHTSSHRSYCMYKHLVYVIWKRELLRGQDRYYQKMSFHVFKDLAFIKNIFIKYLVNKIVIDLCAWSCVSPSGRRAL